MQECKDCEDGDIFQGETIADHNCFDCRYKQFCDCPIMKKPEWVQVAETGALFTEVMLLENGAFMRVYGWDSDKDLLSALTLIPIGMAVAKELINTSRNTK